MKLTPLDIRKQEFRKTLRGFDPIEVQTFLEMVADEYEQLLEKNKQYNNRQIELETKLKDYQENEKNLRETLLNVQEVKKQSEESSRKQADLLIKEAELKATEIIEAARKQAREIRDEVNMLRSQKETFINRLRQILISQIELLSVLEVDEAIPEEAFTFIDHIRSRKKPAVNERPENRPPREQQKEKPVGGTETIQIVETSSVEASQRKPKPNPSDVPPAPTSSTVKSAPPNQLNKDRLRDPDLKKKVDDEINEFFKKEIQIDELMKDVQKKNKK